MPLLERRIRWYQRGLHEDWVNNRYTRFLQIAHRRWGKDEMALQATCELAHKRPATYWHCLPEYNQGRKAIWEAVNAHTGKLRIDEAFPHALRAGTNNQYMTIRLKCGSVWQVIGSDRYDATMGAGPAGIVYSEWALSNPAAWGYHRPMLEENGGWAAFITTPRGRNHLKAMYDMAVNRPEVWRTEISNIYDTLALGEDQIADIKEEYIAMYGKDQGKAQFEQEYECSFNAAILGAYYGAEIAEMYSSGRYAPLTPIPNFPVHRAWDLGMADSTAIWWFQIIPGPNNRPEIRILDYYESHSQPISHYAKVVLDTDYMDGVDWVPHDAKVRELSSGRTRIQTMVREGLNPKVVPNSKLPDGIQAARTTLPLCHFDPKCEDGVNALTEYRREWDDDKKDFKRTPLHNWASHGADAFRYLALAWKTAAKEQADIVRDPIAELLRRPTLDEVIAAFENSLKTDQGAPRVTDG